MDATQLFIPRVTRPGGVEAAPEASPGFAEPSPFVEMLRPAAPRPAAPPATPAEPSRQPPLEDVPSSERARSESNDAPRAERKPDAPQENPPAQDSEAASAPAAQADAADEENQGSTDKEPDAAAEATAAAVQAVAPAKAIEKPVLLAAGDTPAKPDEQTQAVDAAQAKGGDAQLAQEVVEKAAGKPAAQGAVIAKGDAVEEVVQTLASNQATTDAAAAATMSTAAVSEGTAAEEAKVLPAATEEQAKPGKKKVAAKPAEATVAKVAEPAAPAQQATAQVAGTVAPPTTTELTPAEGTEKRQGAGKKKEETPVTAVDVPPDAAPPVTDVASALATDPSAPDNAAPIATGPVPQALHDHSSNARGDAANAVTNNPSSSRLPNWLRGGPSEAAPERRPVVVDSTRFLQRVTRAFEAAQSRGGDVKLRLSPPELGAVQIELRVRDGVLSARLETENSAAKTALLENLPALKERLADQGMRIENFEVNVGSRNPGGTPDRPQDRSDQPRSETPRSLREPERRAPAEQVSRPRTWTGDGALNVIV